jgi:hypothetical protein
MRRIKMDNNRGTHINIPIQFHLVAYERKWQIVRVARDTLFAATQFSSVPMDLIPIDDGWELVRRFFSVNYQEEQAVLKFLVAHGNFEMPEGSVTTQLLEVSQLPIRRVWRREYKELIRKPVEMIMETFSLKEFGIVQDYLRRMLITEDPTLPVPWAAKNIQRYEISFASGRCGSRAHVAVSGTFASILATLQFRLAQGAKFRTCARKDCRLPFEVISRHKRRFCTQYCAHITSLRQRRKTEKKRTRQGKQAQL